MALTSLCLLLAACGNAQTAQRLSQDLLPELPSLPRLERDSEQSAFDAPAIAMEAPTLPLRRPSGPSATGQRASSLNGRDRFLDQSPLADLMPEDFRIGSLYASGKAEGLDSLVRNIETTLTQGILPLEVMSPEAITQARILYTQGLNALPENTLLRVAVPSYGEDGSASLALRLVEPDAETGTLAPGELARGFALLYLGITQAWILEYIHLDFTEGEQGATDAERWDPYSSAPP